MALHHHPAAIRSRLQALQGLKRDVEAGTEPRAAEVALEAPAESTEGGGLPELHAKVDRMMGMMSEMMSMMSPKGDEEPEDSDIEV